MSSLRVAMLLAASSFLPASQLSAKQISYTYKDGTVKTFDTDLFWVENGHAFLTAEAMMAVDKNNQKLNGAYSYAEIAAERDAEARSVMLSQNLILYYRHLADQHKDCIPESIKKEIEVVNASGGDARKKFTDIDARYRGLYGAQWKQIAKDCGCSMSEINMLVRAEMGLE